MRKKVKAEWREGERPGSLTKWALSASYKASREHRSYNASMLHICEKRIPTLLNLPKVIVVIFNDPRV